MSLKLLAVFTAALVATGAAAQPQQPNPPQVALVCVDAAGALKSPRCYGPASRLDRRDDTCTCADGVQVEASVCPPGAPPPPESAALAKARREILRGQHSLVGASFEGRPLCTPPTVR